MEHDFKTPDDVTEFESKMAKEAVKAIPQKDKAKLEKAVKSKKTSTLSMADQYVNAWKSVYSKLPNWRKKELDKQLECGRLSDKEWDNDFVRQVIALAESDDPQAI
jgi:hypothetical protein